MNVSSQHSWSTALSRSMNKRVCYESISSEHDENNDFLGVRNDTQNPQRPSLLDIVSTIWQQALYVSAVASVAVVVWLSVSGPESFELKTVSKHTIPTLLSLIHPETNSFLNALDNEVYQHIHQLEQQQSFPNVSFLNKKLFTLKDEDDVVETESNFMAIPPTLILDRTRVRYKDPFMVQWTDGLDASGNAIVTDESVLILSCGSTSAKNDASFDDDFDDDQGEVANIANNREFSDHKLPTALHNRVVLEAATIAQVKATSSWHRGSSNTTTKVSSSRRLFQPDVAAPLFIDPIAAAAAAAELAAETAAHQWYIPSFPVIRQDACQFLLYNPVQQTKPSARIKSNRHNRNHDDDYNSNEDKNDVKNDSGHRQSFRLLAASDIFWLSSPLTPTAIHLAVTNDPSVMIVQFVTGAAGIPVVKYGISTEWTSKKSNDDDDNDDDDDLTMSSHGTSDTYTASDMCEAPANETELGKFQAPGQLHTVYLKKLRPNQLYRYKVGLVTNLSSASSSKAHTITTWSKHSYIFQSSLTPGDHQPFSYLVYGDQGCPATGWGYGGEWTAALAAREIHNHSRFAIRAVHHFGDLSYARGAAHIWDEWFGMIQPFSTHVPLMIAVGNHEYDHLQGGQGKDPSGLDTDGGYRPIWGNFGTDSGGECGVPTAKRFHMPSSVKSNGVFWYSHDYGSVHTTVLSSEHDLSLGSPQHVWLEQDLRAVNRSVTPWLIVELHRPLYESEAVWSNNAIGLARRIEIEHLLRNYKVDLVLAGHYHAYLRTCDGLFRSRCNNGGPMHITVGSAGAHLDQLWLYWNTWTEKFIQHEYGYGRITVMNATALHFQFVKAGDPKDPTSGDVHDDVWIIRDRGLK